MKMCRQLKHFVYIFVCGIYMFGSNANEIQLHLLKNCTHPTHCPDNSICMKVENNFNCICWHGYFQNTNWSEDDDTDLTDSSYCTRNVVNKTVVIYNRLPPNREHLAIAISLILIGVIFVTLLFYCFGLVRPIKRTQAAYRRLQLRRKNHRRLEEFDDIDMTFRETRSAEELS